MRDRLEGGAFLKDEWILRPLHEAYDSNRKAPLGEKKPRSHSTGGLRKEVEAPSEGGLILSSWGELGAKATPAGGTATPSSGSRELRPSSPQSREEKERRGSRGSRQPWGGRKRPRFPEKAGGRRWEEGSRLAAGGKEASAASGPAAPLGGKKP